MMERSPLGEDIQNDAQNIVDKVREPLLIVALLRQADAATAVFWKL